MVFCGFMLALFFVAGGFYFLSMEFFEEDEDEDEKRKV